MNSVYSPQPEEWVKIHQFLCLCSQAENPEKLAETIIDNIGQVCSLDAASAYLISPSGKVTGHALRNTDEKWDKLYLAYYINTDEGRYDMRHCAKGLSENPLLINCHNWSEERSSEFIPDFVCVRGLTYSCGFGLYESVHKNSMVVALDRLGTADFTPDEVARIRLLLPVLNGFFKNFYYVSFPASHNEAENEKLLLLTARESQIADLLCQSASPAEISSMLHISRSTTYKHISNIYEKLQISSQRELLALLLHP